MRLIGSGVGADLSVHLVKIGFQTLGTAIRADHVGIAEELMLFSELRTVDVDAQEQVEVAGSHVAAAGLDP